MRRALSLCACGARLQQQLHGQQHRRVRLLHATRAALADARKDPYGVLGVPKDSGKEDVKKAYYKLVKKCAGQCLAPSCARPAAAACPHPSFPSSSPCPFLTHARQIPP